jgi:methylmalonyl-CoA carboxyltransferase 5S subunit
MEAERAAAATDSKTGPVRGPIKYEITINGKQHSVAVKPA